MRRLGCVLVLAACQAQGGGSDGGLVVMSDTAQMGPPPACNAETPTTSEGTDGDSSGGESTGGAAVEVDELGLSERPGLSRAPDPGTVFCAGFDNHAECDGTPRMDGETLIGECRWVSVVPVVPGTCEATQLYNTCIHVPHDGGNCTAAQSCGQVGLGVYGRTGCDGNVEIVVVPPGEAFCRTPTDWPLCWPDDSAPECSCICS